MAFGSLFRESNYAFSGEKKDASGDYRRRELSTAEFHGDEYSGQSAYEVLGISEKSSSAEIKASFRKLAKETHPDVCTSSDEAAGSLRFLQILAAYEVKHMHWFQIGEDEVPIYECRCTRARLPPSKFWLFEPRSCMHDIGGWYVETFGQNKKGRTVLSQRQWDGINEHPEKRLHPAIYLLALAYRTLDLEDKKRSKVSIRDILKPKVHNILRWCKRLL